MKALFLMGSKSDQEFANKIIGELDNWGIESEGLVASAHKVPEKVYEIVKKNNESNENIVYVTIAGRSNGLSGVTAANSIHPVIACPPFKNKDDFTVNINSTLMMPSDTPVMAVVDPKNAALAVARIFALKNDELREKIRERINEIKRSFN